MTSSRSWFPRLLAATATTQLVVFIVRPVVSYQALGLGADAAELGLVVASFSIVSLCVAVPVGRAVDRHGERGFLAAGCLLLAVTCGVLWRASSLAWLAVGSAVLGLGQMVAMIAIQTIIANGREAFERDRNFATFTLVTSGTQFTAPAVAGVLLGAEHSVGGGVRVGAVYATAVMLSLVGLGLAWWLLRRPGTLSKRPDHFGRANPRAMRAVLGNPTVLVALVVGFAVLSAIDLLTSFMPAYGQDRGLTPRQVGLLVASHGLASVAVRVVLPRLLGRWPRRGLLTASLILGAGALGALPLATTLPVMYGLMVVSGIGLGICAPVAMAWVAGAVAPEVRGTAMSVRMAGNRLGQTVVPLGVAALAGPWGLAAAFVGPAALLAGAAALVAVMPRARPLRE